MDAPQQKEHRLRTGEDQDAEAPVHSSGTWPGSYGYYYLIIQLLAGDDGQTSNNIYTSAAIPNGELTSSIWRR